MKKCHQCNSENLKDGRKGNCGVCFAKDVQFCQKCAMWELGPMDSDKKPLDDMKKVEKEVSVSKQVNAPQVDKLSSLAELPIAPDIFLDAMKEVCPFIEDQLENEDATLYGLQFREYARSAIVKFQELYTSCKHDRTALQVLIVFHLSSQERVQCRFFQDNSGDSIRKLTKEEKKDKKNAEKAEKQFADAKYMKRWQTRTIAKNHLSKHLDKIETQFGKTVKDLVSKKTWLDALGLDEIEYFLKQFYPPTLMAKRLLELANKDVKKARETLEIAIIIYNVLTATRKKDEVGKHWSASIEKHNFTPIEALGYLSVDRYEFLYGKKGDGSKFSKDALDLINKLWNVLGNTDDGNKLPEHPRYEDKNIPGDIKEKVVKDYLQYLPTFDHPQANEKERTDCETIVRKRVTETLKPYREHWLKATYYQKPTITFEENDIKSTNKKTKTVELVSGDIKASIKFSNPKVGHIPTNISKTRRNDINTFVDQLLAVNHLKEVNGKVIVKVTSEMDNERRIARRKNVIDAIQKRFDEKKKEISLHSLVKDNGDIKDWNVDDYLDKLIKAMKDDFKVDMAFGNGTAKALLNEEKVFVPQGWFPLMLKDFSYSEIFPNCGFAKDGTKLSTINEHYERVEGSSPRPAHYMDWRAHKDNWLYDCFNIPQKKRPLFTSLSVQPILPEVNSNYGNFAFLFKRSEIKNRCVHNLGDKQQPRRSMLLLLDDIFYEHTKKDGFPGQSHSQRRGVADDILARMEMLEFCKGLTLEKQWELVYQNDKVRYPVADLLIESQIFGETKLQTIGKRVIINETIFETQLNKKLDESIKYLETKYKIESLTYPDKQYDPLNPLLKNRKDYSHPSPEGREDLLNKKAKDNASLT